jgi:hypothetical protein
MCTGFGAIGSFMVVLPSSNRIDDRFLATGALIFLESLGISEGPILLRVMDEAYVRPIKKAPRECGTFS